MQAADARRGIARRFSGRGQDVRIAVAADSEGRGLQLEVRIAEDRDLRGLANSADRVLFELGFAAALEPRADAFPPGAAGEPWRGPTCS